MSCASDNACYVSDDDNGGPNQENSAQKVPKKMPFEKKPKPGKQSNKH